MAYLMEETGFVAMQMTVTFTATHPIQPYPLRLPIYGTQTIKGFFTIAPALMLTTLSGPSFPQMPAIGKPETPHRRPILGITACRRVEEDDPSLEEHSLATAAHFGSRRCLAAAAAVRARARSRRGGGGVETRRSRASCWWRIGLGDPQVPNQGGILVPGHHI